MSSDTVSDDKLIKHVGSVGATINVSCLTLITNIVQFLHDVINEKGMLSCNCLLSIVYIIYSTLSLYLQTPKIYMLYFLPL